MPWRVSFEIWGEEFRPSRVPLQFAEQHDPGAMPYGSASYVVPPSVPNTDRIKHVVQVIEPVLAQIRAAGATDWHISIGRFYYGQCNEEYSLEELQLITRLGCGFIYSAYSVSEDEERELEQKYETFRPVA